MVAAPHAEKITKRLETLYPQRYEQVANSLLTLIDDFSNRIDSNATASWDQRQIVLITYADHVQDDEQTPLQCLNQFLLAHEMEQCLSTVHFLPFFPYSSDDGFSVIDYEQINPDFGTWEDVEAFRSDFELMFDLVLNHCSQHSAWFQKFLKQEPGFETFFVTADPATDLSSVTRPRSHPLLTPFETSAGTKHVWTTFSEDQVDLNYEDPQVLLEMMRIFLTFIERGSRIVRLDAIAYLWKQIGTSCIHLLQTHEVVKLMRDIVDAVAPETILLTETNVPHKENVSYFGAGDEAHMIYQFSLAPLLLDAFVHENAAPFNAWLKQLATPEPGTTYFNFTASHDGIGVRPLEGLVGPERFERVIEEVIRRGGRVSHKRNSDGTESPYELNITYASAVEWLEDGLTNAEKLRPFLCSQAIMLALQGIPGVYFASLFGAENDFAGLEQTGRARSINRHKFSLLDLEESLLIEGDRSQSAFDPYFRMLTIRGLQPAFHPEVPQIILDLGTDSAIAFQRRDEASRQTISIIANVTSQTLELTLPAELDVRGGDILHPRTPETSDDLLEELVLAPYEVEWIANRVELPASLADET